MKVLIFVAFSVAVAAAGYGPAYYPQHIPVLNSLGVPVDTPEVQHARAAHFAAHGQAYVGPALYGAAYSVAHAPIYGARYISASHYEVPQIGPNGIPLDTTEVAAAKAHHFAAYSAAAHRNGVVVPIDTPEVQHAKAAHFAAHAEAASRAHGLHYRKRRSAAYQGPYHVPVIGANGVPLDTPAVQQERANHFALFSKAASNAAANPDYGNYAAGAPAHAGAVAPYSAQAAPEPVQRPWNGPIHIPVINQLGVPVDTQEVQHARSSHFADFSKAAAQAAANPDPHAQSYAAPWAQGRHY